MARRRPRRPARRKPVRREARRFAARIKGILDALPRPCSPPRRTGAPGLSVRGPLDTRSSRPTPPTAREHEARRRAALEGRDLRRELVEQLRAALEADAQRREQAHRDRYVAQLRALQRGEAPAPVAAVPLRRSSGGRPFRPLTPALSPPRRARRGTPGKVSEEILQAHLRQYPLEKPPRIGMPPAITTDARVDALKRDFHVEITRTALLRRLSKYRP